jgi:methionine-rich copper-binding protein CopC
MRRLLSRRRLTSAAGALLVALVALLVHPVAASAHDELVTSTPANGAHVRVLPRTVVLNFEEPPVAGYTKVHIYGPSGTDLSAAAPVTTDSRVILAVKPSAARGAYVIRWSLLSDDGHPVAGVVRFTVATAPAPTTSPAKTTATAAPAPASAAGSTWIVPAVIGVAALLVLFGAAKVTGRRRA